MTNEAKLNQEELVYDIVSLVEKAEVASDTSKEEFIGIWDNLEKKVEHLKEEGVKQLVETLKKDYSDNWVAVEVIELVANC